MANNKENKTAMINPIIASIEVIVVWYAKRLNFSIKEMIISCGEGRIIFFIAKK